MSDKLQIEWIFDPIPPSGAIQGGVPSSHVFKPDLDTFVREIIQNSMDQKTNGLVTVNFVFEKMEGHLKDDFLNAIDWQNLRKHVEASAEAGFTTISPRLAYGLQNIESGPLTILRIDDFGTVGLTGGESEPSKNFSALCKNTLDTCEDKPYRGGSYGLGKAVLWSFSSISAVLFSSFINLDSSLKFRLIGRTELSYHITASGQWSGPGWYGKPEMIGQGLNRAASAWDTDAQYVATGSHMLRDIEKGAGTSILVIGFDEPRQEQTRELKEIAYEISRSASRWFWPSLKEPDSRLAVNVEAYENGNEIYNQKVEVSTEESPFVEALSESEFVEKLEQQGDVSKTSLLFRIPAKKPYAGGAEEPECDAQLELRVRQGGTEDSPELKNSVALIRGAGMVVQYLPVPIPLSDKKFHGMLLAGLANGTTTANESAEKFFRAAEPPSHREWDAATDGVRAEYKQGGQARLKGLWQEMTSAIIKMCQESIPASSQGPERLSRLFRIGGQKGGWGGPAKFRIAGITANLEEDAWHFSGRITRQSEENKPWEFTVSNWLAGETGRGDLIPIHHLEVDNGEVVIGPATATVIIPANVSRVSFSGDTIKADKEQRIILRNTKMRIEVRPRFRS